MNTPSSRNTLIAVGVVAALGVSAGALAQSTESSQPKARSETMGATSADYADAMRSYERQEYRQALQMFRDLATAGDADAQYMLGRMYEAGSGTLQDFVEAHKWYNLAAAAGHRHAATARDTLAGRMTAKQIAQAQRQAQAWQPTSAAPATTVPPAMETLSGRDLLAGIQRELSRLGYDPGSVDGLMGSRTRNAIRAYQGSVGLAEDGRPSTALLARLRQDAPATQTPDSSREVRIALEDDFSDGDFQRNPAWTVQSGRFEVEEGGLRTVVELPRVAEPTVRESGSSSEQIGRAVLQLILEQAAGLGTVVPSEPDTTAPEPARIFVRAPVGNAFELDLELASYQRPGSIELGLYQGDQPGAGYRLVYNAGARPGLSLVRLTRGGGEVIATSEGPLDLENGRTHTLNWTRNPDGVMQVRVDGRRVLQAHDRALRQGFQGFLLVNHGGDYNLRRIRLEG